MTRGILKNAQPDAPYRHEPTNSSSGTPDQLDRQQVIANTRANAAMHAQQRGQPKELDDELREIVRKANAGDKLTEEERLKWDERNLLINEMEKSATMKIDEPKTPYEGGFDPNNDYYRTDNENDNEHGHEHELEHEHEDDFALGEGVDDANDVAVQTIEADTVSGDQGDSEDESQEEVEETAAERHARFEAMRRAHYAHKADPLKRPLPEPEEDEDENKDDNENENEQ